ncbi:MAG: adenosylmethionine decarboxylase [Myxococcaceae bacterium]|nr:adenosylmethionine decarboxylase [Myxococcaceae bacterium]
MEGPNVRLGQEWLVDCSGCRPAALRDLARLKALFAELVATLSLTVVGEPQWHVFPGEGGVTGLTLLSESHLAIHTFPEHGFAALSVYSCRTREAPDFERIVARHLEPARVAVRTVEREAQR